MRRVHPAEDMQDLGDRDMAAIMTLFDDDAKTLRMLFLFILIQIKAAHLCGASMLVFGH
ncbi:hypothetical protein HXZ76_00325 [Acinetobacter indicus]|uniref:hypothetical protein n=1 Tax=Acinetobacter indicus TaxID=756892 RepID=UPI002576FC53|nr:hypothetical protein [Acinetobacter indicus]MDM1302794.1 hypothetical protein [Acinetobacter indicus]